MGITERIKAIEDEMARMQKNKGTTKIAPPPLLPPF